MGGMEKERGECTADSYHLYCGNYQRYSIVMPYRGTM